jgi:hypothetical protein
MDVRGCLTSGIFTDGEIVWSWRRDAGVKFVMLLRITRMTGTRKPVPRGDHV